MPEESWRSIADHVARRALGFVASDRAVLARFMTHSGLAESGFDGEPVRQEHLAAVLDFLIADEPVLQKFTHASGLPLEAAYDARRTFDRKGWRVNR